MLIGIPRESAAGEKRAALTPDALPKLKAFKILVERGAGKEAGFPDSDYQAAGAGTSPDFKSLASQADILIKVAAPSPEEADALKSGAVLISYFQAASHAEALRKLMERKATVFAMDLMPRISRAQAMDVLSSQATIAGYKAVVMAAESLPRLFPMLITAAGTVPPAKVFVIGAGVAGLQAIATARRLGASVEAYDVRPAVKEQIESLGARFASFSVEAKDAQDKGGYAKAQSEEFYKKQQEFIAQCAKASDIVVTTALIPGRRAPILITEQAVKGMRPGSVVVDLAAEQGGNCALTQPGRTVVQYGVTIHGPLNLPSSLPSQASQMYARNVAAFLAAISKDGQLNLDLNNELVRGPMLLQGGQTVHDSAKNALGQTPAGAKA